MIMHEGQLAIDAGQVRRLVAAQFPEWAGLAVYPVASTGTVNALFRIGDELVARFPLVGGDAEEVRSSLVDEAERAGELARSTSVPTPVPVALGEPGEGYGLPWSVQTWLPGTDANTRDPGGSVGFAADLASFILELRGLDTRGRTFDGSGRGGELGRHDEWMETCFANSAGLLDVAAVRALWQDLRPLPSSGPDVMSHTDLIPGNVLVEDDRLAGVLDGGGFRAADPGLDLVAAWHLLEPVPRQVFRDAVGCTNLEWDRGRAWALEQAMGAAWYYEQTNPAMSRMGVRTIERLLAPRP
ncbi:MAG TPA: aminoglycoside phosphotransferase family protein [Propionicimonas sp.]|jgi:aminoglycoside phosphotransferase (APT) family kinase protein